MLLPKEEVRVKVGGGGGHILSVGAIADWKRECLSKAVIPFSMILKIRDLPYMVRLGVSS